MNLEEAKDYLYATLKVLTKNTDEEIRAYIEMLETESPQMTIAELEKEIAKLKERGIPLEGIKQIKEPCEDAISRQAVYEVLDSMLDDSSDNKRNQLVSLDSIADEIAELPPVTPQPKTGHWIKQEDGTYKCSNCKKYELWEGIYCASCGAKMEGE